MATKESTTTNQILTCRMCGASKPYGDFYRALRNTSGYRTECKKCTNEVQRIKYFADPEPNRKRAKLWREAHPERERENHRRNRDANPAAANERNRRYYIRNRERLRAADAREMKRSPEKFAARFAVNNAVRDGRLAKPTACETCGATGRLHGHHHDYSRPLDVKWLCAKCHAQIHAHGV
jgi:hypothetical protein